MLPEERRRFAIPNIPRHFFGRSHHPSNSTYGKGCGHPLMLRGKLRRSARHANRAALRDLCPASLPAPATFRSPRIPMRYPRASPKPSSDPNTGRSFIRTAYRGTTSTPSAPVRSLNRTSRTRPPRKPRTPRKGIKPQPGQCGPREPKLKTALLLLQHLHDLSCPSKRKPLGVNNS
jgi:hypothetical protein